MHRNLRSFLEVLHKENELLEIQTEVDPYLEIAEIHRRVIDEGGPALLFTNVKGSSFPIVTNLFGTKRRVDMAFGPKPEHIVKGLVGAMDKLMPPKPKALWQERQLLRDVMKTGTKKAKKAPVMETYHTDFDMTSLPALTSWHEDGGPFITLPLVYTESPSTKEHNLGMYRIQIHEKNQTGMHWQIHKGGGFHHHEAEQSNQNLPVTLYLGGPPALTTAAIAPLPEMVPELVFASLLVGEKIGLIQPDQSPHALVAEAEFAFSGHVPPHVRKPEGPFGDHYGYYSLQHDFPVFNIDRVWHRKDAIFPATIVGKPRQEDYYIGEYLQSLLSPLFPVVMPGVKSLWTYAETGFHSLAGAVVRESYYKEAMAHAFRIMGEGQLTLTKFLMVSDVDVNLAHFAPFFENILARFQPERDLLIINDTSMDTLDYTARGKINKGSKAIMTGLGDPIRELPRTYQGGHIDRISKAAVYCGGCLMLAGKSFEEDPDLAEYLVKEAQEQLSPWPVVVLVDDVKVAENQTSFLWTTFTRFDPASDIYADAEIIRNKIAYRGPIIIDARMKPMYPKELFPREDIVELVDRRWREYFPK
jgi:UbiD family decarboxylase